MDANEFADMFGGLGKEKPKEDLPLLLRAVIKVCEKEKETK